MGYMDADRLAYIPVESQGLLYRTRSVSLSHTWRHWSGRVVYDSPSVGGTLVEILFVRCLNGRGYQRRLFTILNEHRQYEHTACPNFTLWGVSIDLVVFSPPLDRLPLITKPRFLAED